jgi:hypothetical protein
MPQDYHTNAQLSFDEGYYPRQTHSSQAQGRSWVESLTYAELARQRNPPLPLQVQGSELRPNQLYILSIHNSDFLYQQPFTYSVRAFVPSSGPSMMQPYMSIVLGVTAAVILCMFLTVCKRCIQRHGFGPWIRPEQPQRRTASARANFIQVRSCCALCCTCEKERESVV